MIPAVLVREGNAWRQYFVITDRRVAVVEMVPALLCGWRFHSVTIQDGDSWGQMSRDTIVAWKFDCDDGKTKIANDLDDTFRVKLFEKAGL